MEIDLGALGAFLNPFIPFLTALIGALTALGAVWAKARHDAKVRTADIAREEAKESKLSARETRRRVSERATKLADLFLDELQEVRKFNDEQWDFGFPIWYEERWRTSGNIPFRRDIARVEDAGERTQLVEILDSLDDFRDLAQWKYFSGGEQRWVEEVLTLGFDLASTMARGQEPDERFSRQYTAFRVLVDSLESYREDQREAEREARKERMEAQSAGEPA